MDYVYYNQKKYPNVSYPLLTDYPEAGFGRTTFAQAGCGLCAASMLVENMLKRPFPLIESLELSVKVGGNHSIGTDMHRLAPHIAERFSLEVKESAELSELLEHLKAGYQAIAYITGDRPEAGYTGVFSHGAHYVTVVAYEEERNRVVILDPSQLPGKFDEEGRTGKVEVDGYVLRCTPQVLDEDVTDRDLRLTENEEIRKWALAEPGNETNGIHYFLFKPKK